jgi:uncharacterized membrane protein YkoI
MSRMNVISALVAATLGLGSAGAALASDGKHGNHHEKGNGDDDRAAVARLRASPTTLSQAIQAAERQTGGKAMAASIVEKNGTNPNGPAVFVVEVARNDAIDRVTVDGATGQIVKVAPDDQGGEHHDGDHDQEDDD